MHIYITVKKMGFFVPYHQKNISYNQIIFFISPIGLQIVYEYFSNLGYENENIIMIIKHIPQRYLSEQDTNLLTFFKDIGTVYILGQ